MLKPEDAEKVLTKNLANVIRKANAGKPLTAAERALIEQSAAGGPATDSGSAFAKSYDELAQRFGLTRKTLQNASQRFPEDAPRPRADGRHDVAAWSQFLIRHNIARTAENIAGAPAAESQGEGTVTVTDWKARELRLKCEKLEIENGKTAGQLVEASEVESGVSAMVSGFNQALDNFGPRLAAKMSGVALDYHEAEEIIAAEIAVLKRTLQRCDFLGQMDSTAATLQTAAPVVADPRAVAKELPDQRTSSKGSPKAGSKKPAKSPTGPPASSKEARKVQSVSAKVPGPVQKAKPLRSASTTKKRKGGA